MSWENMSETWCRRSVVPGWWRAGGHWPGTGTWQQEKAMSRDARMVLGGGGTGGRGETVRGPRPGAGKWGRPAADRGAYTLNMRQNPRRSRRSVVHSATSPSSTTHCHSQHINSKVQVHHLANFSQVLPNQEIYKDNNGISKNPWSHWTVLVIAILQESHQN